MVVVLFSHAISIGLNYHHIMTGSVLLSSIAEYKCTKLKKYNHALRRTNITPYDDVSNWSNVSSLSVRLLIWKPVASFKTATLCDLGLTLTSILRVEE
jgi:hypothetical protein